MGFRIRQLPIELGGVLRDKGGEVALGRRGSGGSGRRLEKRRDSSTGRWGRIRILKWLPIAVPAARLLRFYTGSILEEN